MAYHLDDAVESTRRWLDLRNDVLLVGDDGAGKTTVMRSVSVALRRTWAAIMVEGSTANPARPLLPLVQHPLVTSLAANKLTPSVIENAFVGELEHTPAFVLVDDLHQLDPETITALGSILRRSGALLIASVDLDFHHSGTEQQLALLTRRPTAEVRIEPLGYAGVGQALTDHLGSAPDAALLASIVSRSAGNPRVALAVADAARWAGSIERTGGVWSETGSIDDVPLRSVVYALTGRIRPEERSALEILSWAGPLRIEEATKLADAATIATLANRGRLATYTDAGSEVLTVSPPALAKALRQQLNDVRRHQYADMLHTVLGMELERIVSEPENIAKIFEIDDVGSEEYWRFAADLAANVQERGAVQENVLWSRWTTEPTVANAVALLESTLGRRSNHDLDQVFESTDTTDEELSDILVRFVLLQAHWAAGRDERSRAVDTLDVDSQRFAGWGGLFRYVSGVLQHNGSGTSAPPPDMDELAKLGPVAQDWFAAAQAHTLLEAARAEEAIDVVADRQPANSHVRLFLEAVHSDALLAAGDLDVLERYSRARLHEASDELNPARIRIHALGLAEAFYFGGHMTAGWQVLSIALRLGPPGPFDVGRYSRIVAIAIALQFPARNRGVIEMLRHELERVHDAVRSPLGDARTWAKAYLRFLDGDEDGANEDFWRYGLEDVQQGYLTSATLFWGSMIGVLPPERSRQVQNLLDRIPTVLYSPYLELQVVLAGSDDDALINALRGGKREMFPRITRVAVDRIQELRAARGHTVLTDSEITALVGALPAKVARPALPADDVQGRPLTEREREVAVLARSGKSNREIAKHLTVSTRTVENHVYRALRKLGLASRNDLVTQWDPALPHQLM